MALVHATVTRPLRVSYYQQVTRGPHTRYMVVPPRTKITYDPLKYVWQSQPFAYKGRTVWASITDLHASIDLTDAEAREQFLGQSRSRHAAAPHRHSHGGR